MPSASRARFGRGFTLLELLVVLAIFALLSVIVAPRLSGTGATVLDADARMVLAGVRRAKAEALREQAPAELFVDIQARVVRTPGEAKPRELSNGIRIGMVTARSQSNGSASGSLRFYPDGSSTGGRIALAAGELIKLIDVDWLTGRVQVTEAYGALDDALRTEPL